MQRANGILVLLTLAAVILLGFIAGKVAEPPQALPTYTPWPTYTPLPTYTALPTRLYTITISKNGVLSTDLSAASFLDISPFTYYPLNLITKKYPRVDGSTSTKPLEDIIVCHIYRISCSWEFSNRIEERHIDMTALSWVLSAYIEVPVGMLPQTEHNGTHQAYENLINGKTDFILVARLPSEDELSDAKASGVKLDAQPVALDAFVMLAHADNPVNTISVEQIRGVYSGKIINWLQLGGVDFPVHAYQREENSGSQELLKSLVMGDIPTIVAPEMIVTTMSGPFNVINGDLGASNVGFSEQGDPNGLGYSVYYYTWFIMGPLQNVKILAVDGVRPTSQTIANRTYPLIADVYVVIRAGEPADSTSVLLRDWLLTKDGQSVVEENGYIPITPPQ